VVEADLGAPQGPIHGDANVGNLLRSDDGTTVLSDLDGFSIGPREWDLVFTAMYTDLYGWHTEQEYSEFVDAYGWDIRSWSGYHSLRDIRELLMVLWLVERSKDDKSAANELRTRIETLRTDGSRKGWKPL
jgi:aminoglycoside phosphotransferase (APT) family kinase protein